MVKSFPSRLPDFDFDGQLQQLANKVQQYSTHSQERQLALSELVNVILRTHRLCRPSKLLPVVVQQISLDLQQQLLHDISKEIDDYNPQRIPIKEWANSLRDIALKKILSDSIINQIAQEAKQAATGSNERRLALNLLIEAIQIADKFCHPHNGSFSFPPGVYEYIYNEAMQTTLLEICLNIDRYNPSHDLMAWVNFLLPRRFSDTCKKYLNQGLTNSPIISTNITNNHQSQSQIVFINNEETLQKVWQKEEAAVQEHNLRDFIEKDSARAFSNEHIQGRPEVNFQIIALEKIWGGKTWKDLAETWQISIQTLSSFFYRCLKKFRHLFLEYLQD